MKPRKSYLNCTLAGVPYLLPYGQSIEDRAAGLQVNPAGARLWDSLSEGADRDSALALLAADCPDTDRTLSKPAQDLDDFLAGLARHGAILRNAPASPYAEHLAQIGPLVLSLRIPDSLWNEYFHDFECHEKQEPHQRILFYPQLPTVRENGTILVRSADLIIAETDDSYLFLPLASSALKEMHVTKDGALAGIYCSVPTADNIEELFHAIRFAFLVIAAHKDLYVIHSASILYRSRAWLFSGSSGAGKSTHTNLWNHEFGTPILNGDLNLIGITDGIPVCYGLPWCGTSGKRTAGSWPLGGIAFVKKAIDNEVLYPPLDQKILYLSQRLISPAWTAQQLAQNLAFCERLASCTPIFRLCCTKDARAAYVMQKAIEESFTSH